MTTQSKDYKELIAVIGLITWVAASLVTFAVWADMPASKTWEQTAKEASQIQSEKAAQAEDGGNYWFEDDNTTSNTCPSVPLKPLAWTCGRKCKAANSGEKWLAEQASQHTNKCSVRVFMFLDYLSNLAACKLLKQYFSQSVCKFSKVPKFEKKVIAWIKVRDAAIDAAKNHQTVDSIMEDVNKNYGKRLKVWSSKLGGDALFKGVPPEVMNFIK